MAEYKGIKFRKGYDLSFADFKKEFGSNHIFKAIPHLKRDSELKKAYKIATKGNGNTVSTIKKVGKNKSEQPK